MIRAFRLVYVLLLFFRSVYINLSKSFKKKPGFQYIRYICIKIMTLILF